MLTIPRGATCHRMEVVCSKMSAPGLTTMLTTTHDDTGGHKTTSQRAKVAKVRRQWTHTNTSGRSEANSKNRRVQVRFLTHLPSQILNLWALQPHGAQPILCALTPFDPNGGNTANLTDYPQPVIDVLVQQRLPASFTSPIAIWLHFSLCVDLLLLQGRRSRPLLSAPRQCQRMP